MGHSGWGHVLVDLGTKLQERVEALRECVVAEQDESLRRVKGDLLLAIDRAWWSWNVGDLERLGALEPHEAARAREAMMHETLFQKL